MATRRRLAAGGEKWAIGEQRLAETRRAMAFPDETVLKARDVLTQLLDSPNDKERRLTAVHIRAEAGYVPVTHQVEHAHLHVSIDPNVLALAQQHRPAAKVISVRATPDEGWKQPTVSEPRNHA